MKAGQTLDRAIAEQVFRHLPIKWVGGMPDDAYAPYSTDMAAASLVMEKYLIALIPAYSEDGEDVWAAHAFTGSKGNDKPFLNDTFKLHMNSGNGWQTAYTAPLAICLAALAALKDAPDFW